MTRSRQLGLAGAVLGALALGFWLGSPADGPPEPSPPDAPAASTLWTCSMHPQIKLPEPGDCPICGMDLIPMASEPAPAHAHAEPRWTCSMHPRIELPEAGDCPICGMDLIPQASDGMASGGMASGGMASDGMASRRLTLSPEAKRLARVRTAPVERRSVSHELRLAGKVAYDPTRLADITAHFAGRIERVFVDYPGMRVRRGDHLYEIYSPDIVTAHQELATARRSLARMGDGASPAVRDSAERTLEAVRDRLRRWGLSKNQVARLEKQKKAPDRLTIYSPTDGIVIEQARLEGSYVETGTRLYRIADLNWVWVEAWAYEQHLPWVRFGQTVRFTVDAAPGEAFEGRVAYVDPYLDDVIRAAKVRISVPNPDGRLKPGMFAKLTIASTLAGGGRLMEPSLAGHWVCPMHPHVVEDDKGRCPVCGMRLAEAESLGYDLPDPDAPLPLVVPRSAPLWTGQRSVVYVEVPGAAEPTYEGRVVSLGPEAGDAVVVREGLVEGERVVIEGNFKLDASLQIRARPSMMNPEEAPASQPASQPTSQPASQPASQPTSQPASQPASQPTSQPAAEGGR